MPPVITMIPDHNTYFAVYTHRPVGSKRFVWYECINNDVDPALYLTVITKLHLVQDDETTLHFGYINPDGVVITRNCYHMDDISNRAMLWVSPHWFHKLEVGYDALVDQLKPDIR